MGRVGRNIFHIFFKKNIQFACSQINLLELGQGALNNRPTCRAARKENWGFRLIAESPRKPQISSFSKEVPPLI